MFAGLLFQLKVVTDEMFYRLAACNLLSLSINNQGGERSPFEVSGNSYIFSFIFFLIQTMYLNRREQNAGFCGVEVKSKMQ